jgi:glycosyltransferase involved in cell wall biosynthesis
MKLLVLHSELGILRGGGENFSRNLFPAFVERGHRVSIAFVANRAGNYPIGLPTHLEAIPIKGWWAKNLGQSTLSAIGSRLPDARHLKKSWTRIQDSLTWRTFRWHNLRFQRRIQREFRDRWSDFDAVYVHGDTPLAYMASQYKPTIIRLPGPVGLDLAPMLQKVHAVCANGDALARVQSFLGDHAKELPIGVNLDHFSPGASAIRSKLHWTDNDFVIGYAGRFTHLKGVDLLAQAFRAVRRIVPHARLLLVGSGEEERNLRNLLAPELNCGAVHMRRDMEHDELGAWYRAMNLFVMPSRYENFSNAVVEAMACGVPFLASDVGGNRTLAQTGTGSLFPCGLSDSLAGSLECFARQSQALEEKGKVAAEYVKNCHSWDRTAERLESYLSVLMQTKNERS